METKPLGDTGEMIPEIGLGTWRYRGGVEPLRKGIELGASLIDTAEGYHTEDVVGEATKDIRQEAFIATKVSGRNLRYDDVLKSCDQSLELLQTDRIDLYQVHWPNPRYPIDETMRAMERLADSGKIGYIGVSNFSVEDMQEAQHYLRNYRIVSNQVLYNLNSRVIERELLPYCQRNNITVLAYTPLDGGNLAKQPRPVGKGKMEILQEIANEVGKTLAQVALNWCVSHENVVAIPKSNSVERTEENCGASGWYLSDEQMERLDRAFS